ncbi:MAG: hypothetical protein S4CHLAM45_02500 [Chlamydiales bacterium]|nr:hypothetical protein [Chlamydiales bacterium]MCH9619109.1 hypothetical protein [Chlamydiales bacterium]MCH9622371.1 hypothetical protein [Chlamydiales bacterium]
MEKERFETLLRKLDQTVVDRDKEGASAAAQEVEKFALLTAPKNLWDHVRDFIVAIGFAIIVACIIRQFWFELYEVPTGSMRPTIQELDRLLVTKPTFGLHLPFYKKMLFYKPEYVNRGGTIVFTAAGIDMSDPDMVYFGIYKGKKRLVKRNMSKPGDTLYFYGGLIYGIDKDGKPFTQLSDLDYLKEVGLERIDHVPTISFQGKILLKNRTSSGIYTTALFKQMNLPLGKLSLISNGLFEGEFFNGSEWVKDNPNDLKSPHSSPVSYSDLWGIGNYAEVRLLSPDEVKQFYDVIPNRKALLFLELSHTPNLTYPKPEMRRGPDGNFHPTLTPYTSLIPLDQNHLDSILSEITTSRFCVQNGLAHDYRKGRGRPQPPAYDPKLPKMGNGCYEFYYGKGYKVLPGGFRINLPKENPSYQNSVENVKKLFNQGMKWNLLADPRAPVQPYNPSRYAYYRNGDLYLMGAPILKKDDPTLIKFVADEKKKEDESSSMAPYIAFVDRGPPLLESGELNVDFIRSFGLKVPDNAVVALGDNYAASSDSRDFGFVPINNLRGSPAFTFWPPGSRLGPLVQPPYRWFTFPNLLVWSIAALVIIGYTIYIYRRNRRSIFKK